MRIGLAGLWHETNSFCAERNDQIECVRVERGEALVTGAHPKSFIGGFVEAASGPGVEIVPTAGVRFAHGGPISPEVYEFARGAILEGLRSAGELDGVFFGLHGAMVGEAPYMDAEGELLRSAREAFGEIPMVGTYDFHAIMSDWEVENLVPFPNNTNPHIDGYERGLEAADCLIRMLRGEIRPVTRIVRIPIIGPNIGQSTWSHVTEEERRLMLYQLNLERERLEETPGVINLTLLGGYGYGDSPDLGMSVVATTDGEPDLAQKLAGQLAQTLWERREELLTVRPIHSIDEGVALAIKREQSPVLLVDLGDDPGSACSADSPAVLESLIRHGARGCALTIRDSAVVEEGLKAGVGETLTMPVGGTVDSRFYTPLKVTGTIRSIDDGTYTIKGPTHGGWGREVNPEAFRETHVGPRVVLRIGNEIDGIFSNGRTGKDRDFFKSAGIDPEHKHILVVKSNQAHRASFDPIVVETIELNSPGASTVSYESLPYRHLKRPMWPIDRDMEWSG